MPNVLGSRFMLGAPLLKTKKACSLSVSGLRTAVLDIAQLHQMNEPRDWNVEHVWRAGNW